MKDSWKKIKEVLYLKSLSYILKMIKTELINKYHDNCLKVILALRKFEN